MGGQIYATGPNVNYTTNIQDLKIVLRSLRLVMKRKRLKTAFLTQNWSSDVNEGASFSELEYSTSFLGCRLPQLYAL